MEHLSAPPRSARSRISRRLWLWWLLCGLLIAMATPLLGTTVRSAVYALIALGSLVAIVATVRLRRPELPVLWWSMAGAVASSFVANIVWWTGLLADRPVALGVTLADVLYLGMYLAIAIGLLCLPMGRAASAWTGLTEAGIVLCTGAVLAWALLYDPFLMDGPGWSGSPAVLAYPVLDLIVLAATTRVMVAQRRLSTADHLLILSAVLLAAADIVYFVSYANGGSWEGPTVSSVGWMLVLVMVGAAALHPQMGTVPGQDAGRPRRVWRTAALNMLLVLIGPAATGYLMAGHDGVLDTFDYAVPLTATALIAVLLVVRMTHATRLAHRRAAEQARLQRSLTHQASHDALTGLPNRVHLERQAAELIADGRRGVLLLLDLDGFKDVNDRLGHPTGDALLIVMADRLRTLLGPDETVARLGGDEFALLLPGAGPAGIAVHADRVLAAVRRPVEVDGHVLHLTGSLGARALAGPVTTTQLLSDADLALYAAKAAGRDGLVCYQESLREQQTERIRTAERIRCALERDEFTVHYQPIIALDSGVPVAVEALVRWMPPGQPMIGPDRFIPVAEDSGLIIALGEWVLRRACVDAADWYRRYGTTVTVNVSPRQLADPLFTAKARRALHDSGLPAGALTLEITEGVLLREGAQSQLALAHLGELRAEGVRVAIDDFGTGYSSLSYLRDLPIDVLKIDRSFMPVDDGDARQAALVRAIVDLARSLDLTTVAEGVETVHHADLLRALGCQRGQGYHFARPIPAADLSAMLDARPAAVPA